MNNRGVFHIGMILIILLAMLAVWFILTSHKLGNLSQFTNELISDSKKIIDKKIDDQGKKEKINSILDASQESVENYYKDRK